MRTHRSQPATQRGSILLYAMLTMASMLAIGLTLNGLFLSKLKLAAATRNAATALYAADSGTEMCLYEARKGANDAPLLTLDANGFMVLANGAKFKILNTAGGVDITPNCSVLGSSSLGFRVTGTYLGTSRALEISQ